jgi:alkylation response protein AidB-like acyl-CoA dehydrogenase
MPIDFDLTPQQEDLRAVARELARDFATRALDHDADRSAPVENFQKLREAGLYGLVIPSELGGMGEGMVGWTVVAEELAKGDAATALGFNMHINATGGILKRHGIDADVRARLAALVHEDGALLATSVSEPGSSSLLVGSLNPALEARPADGGYELHGRKMPLSIFEAADYTYLYAHPQGHPSPTQAVALLVRNDQDGLISVTDLWDVIGMRSTRSNQVDFAGAVVPSEWELYQTENFVESFLMEEADFAFGGYTACYLGLGLGIVEWARDQLSSRTGKGYAQPMGYHPTASRRVGEMVADMESVRFLVYRAAWESDARGPGMETFHRWVQAKLAVGAAVQRTAANAAIACGARSLFRAAGLELKLRDAVTAPIMPPNNDSAAEMVGLLSMGLDPQQAPSLRLAEAAPAAV